MTFRLILPFAACLLLLSAHPYPYPCKMDDGLVAHYTFNHCDARDDTGNGSDGKMYGDIGCWCGIEEDGLLFDGIDDYVEFGGLVNDYFTTSDFTISFYFKPHSENTLFKQSMLSKREICTEDYMFDIQLDGPNQLVDTDVHESYQKDFPGLSPRNEGAGWKHFALVRRGIRAYTYINGELQQESRRCSGVDITNGAPLSFSNSPCVLEGFTRRFKGILDELRVYDRALSHLEIRNLYRLYPVESAETDCAS